MTKEQKQLIRKYLSAAPQVSSTVLCEVTGIPRHAIRLFRRKRNQDLWAKRQRTLEVKHQELLSEISDDRTVRKYYNKSSFAARRQQTWNE